MLNILQRHRQHLEEVKPQKGELSYKLIYNKGWKATIPQLEVFINDDILKHNYHIVDVGLTTTARTANENDTVAYVIYDMNHIDHAQPG